MLVCLVEECMKNDLQLHRRSGVWHKSKEGTVSIHWLYHKYFAWEAVKMREKLNQELKLKREKKQPRCQLALLSFPASSRMPPWLAAVITTHLYFAWPYGRSRPAVWWTHVTSRHSPWRATEPSRAETSRCLHPPTMKLPAHAAKLLSSYLAEKTQGGGRVKGHGRGRRTESKGKLQE